MNKVKNFLLYLKSALKSINWYKFLFVSAIIKALAVEPGYPLAVIIICLTGFEAFTYFVREVRVRPMNENVQGQLNDLKTKLASFESRDRIERMANQTTTNTSNTPRRMF